MGIFSKIGKKANEALDKAIDPAKEIDMAILELEEARTKALQELISYKATAKQMEQEIEKYQAKATEWERRAMVAVRAGDDEAAKIALREQKNAQLEVIKIRRDRNEAAGYAVELNKSRKTFDTKLQILKMRKGTLATQLAAARNGGDVFGNDSSVWDKFQRAEDRIDEEAVASEVDAAMRGDEVAVANEFDAKLLAAANASGGGVALLGSGAGTDDALAALKAKVAIDRAARQKALGSGGPVAAGAAPAKPDPDES